MKFCVSTDVGTWTNCLTFEPDPDHSPENLKSVWNLKSVKQAHYSEQTAGHGMHCREILFTPRCSPRAREFPRSLSFFVRRTVAELRGVKIACPIFGFWPIFQYKTPKMYLSVCDQPTAQELPVHRRTEQNRFYLPNEWFRFFHVVVEGPKGCLPAPEIACDF